MLFSHPVKFTGVKIVQPSRIVGVSPIPYLDEPFDRDTFHFKELYNLHAAFGTKDPIAVANGLGILLFNPVAGFVMAMPSLRPLPKGKVNITVNIGEHPFGYHEAMVISPTPENRVKLVNKDFGWHTITVFDNIKGFAFNSFNRLYAGFNQQLPIVLLHVLPKKVKTFVDMGNLCFHLLDL